MWLQICAFECSTSDGLPRWLTQFSAPNVGRIVRQLQGVVGTNQGGQTYVVSFERYTHRHYRKK